MIARPANAAGETRWITSTVALLAIAVFVFSGSQILPALINGDGRHDLPSAQITAFLLNIALILFSWRRTEELKKVTSQRNAAENRAHQLAYFDEVTGIHNRRWLNMLLDELGTAESGQCALVLIDLDRFKKINDLYGHAAGDEVLVVVAARIRSVCPADACCVRLGGDEFAILLRGASARESETARICTELLESLNRPIPLGKTVSAIGASIGISLLGKKCKDTLGLLRRADLAMYEAKRLGRNRCVFFNAAMELDLNRLDKLEAEMKEGIASGQFVPFFQPIVDLATGDVNGFEVLARWNHPTRGLVEPDAFIDAAERTGMISELSFGVMQEALMTARAWPNHYRISVNISPVQFNDPLIAQRIMKILSVTGFPPARLELEVMERSLLEDLDMAISIITSLKNSGISVSVDDFGVGYASLAELKELPFDRIKIDRGFIASLLDDDRCDALVEAIAALGKGLKLPITAEGVEAESLQSKLIELGCTDAQGWVFGKALSAKEVILGFGNLWHKLDLQPSLAKTRGPLSRRKSAAS